ncbi:MAG: NACHT domain-containing protein [Candidatus Delongbacteria bacterium]|nr:NACHT domain-containing protein [Candidatus Delongbacteria bacterium]
MDKPDEIILANLVLPIIKDILMPKIKLILKKVSARNVLPSNLEENFNEYLTQRYEKYLIINTLVFPNKQTLLSIMYQPLTIRCLNERKKEVKILINEYPANFIPKFCRVIIEDSAGMGKSTIAKKLFLSIIEQKAGVPIFIELSQINKKNNILNEIRNQFSPLGKKISQEFILNLLDEGEFIFLFDGFDEIALDDREDVIKDLHKFIEKANQNYFLITSRPDDSLTSFGDFQKFQINPLTKGEAYSLLNKYDNYSYYKISKDLIKQLNDKHQDSLEEYLNNPFLVSLLYKSYEYKKDIPLKKSQFYQQVFDALYETHDLSKEGYLKREKYTNLYIDDFERVLRHLGYFTSIENKVEYDKNGIISFIDKAKSHLSDLSFRSSDYLKDLLNTVPIFKQEGNYYKWGHKSLQDYFSAKCIWIDSKEKQTEILQKIFSDERNSRFNNVLDILFELDPNNFEKSILYWLLTDYSNYSNNAYNKLSKIAKDQLIKRIEVQYNHDFTIVVNRSNKHDPPESTMRLIYDKFRRVDFFYWI